METAKLKKFAQKARRELIEQVSGRLSQVLVEDSLAQREQPSAVKRLQSEIQAHGEQEVIERAAYTWFNRFSALRFMDANHYNRVGVVSPADGQTQPEILAEAKSGHVDETMVPEAVRKRVLALLGGQEKSRDPQGQAYRLLLVAVCNHWHEAMPFMFERIADYTELLMPDDLLSESAVLGPMREAMTVEACQDVEIIGWLYQFYISEKKDQVFARPKGKNIEAEEIPAATQLFTPHWIVRYLVENSLGRLWLLNRPGSKLAERMEYYIAPEERETDFLKISKPEEIKLCDPACGSGHMLTYAFDLLYAIYEEEGYEPTEIPALILRYNLTGVEIDDRAGALAAFALAMKAAARAGRRRFLRMKTNPDIVVMQNVTVTEDELRDVASIVGGDLFTDGLRETLLQFDQAKNFGSLIVPKLRDPAETLAVVEAQGFGGDLLLKEVQARVIAVLRMAEVLSPKYHVVVANPPYMGGKGMNRRLGAWAKDNYPNSKSDLFSMFLERGFDLVPKCGYSAMVTMESWMFLSSYESLRIKIFEKSTIDSMVHMPYLGKGGTSMGISFGTTAAVFHKLVKPQSKGIFICIHYYETDDRGIPFSFPTNNIRLNSVSSLEFTKIPGSPVTYWAGQGVYEVFESKNIGDYLEIRAGLTTGNTDRFLRLWHEITFNNISYTAKSLPNQSSYIPYDKGGEFRKWYGNLDYVLWYCAESMEKMQKEKGFRPDGISYFFRPSITWSKVTSSFFGARYSSDNSGFDATASSAFGAQEDIYKSLIILNSKLGNYLLDILNSTMVYLPRDIRNFPVVEAIWESKIGYERRFRTLVDIAKGDWNFYESSRDFTTLLLLSPEHRGETLEETYACLRAHWQSMTDEMQRLEEANNRIFIDAYGLEDELTPEVPIEEITLTCNPAYRYGVKSSETDRETRLRADTMAEFLSYAVGCMFGRYSLDNPGLILANQGETLADYLAQVPEPSFEPDDDNVIPILDAAWFTDGIVERFREFLKVTFGTEHYEQNLEFIENALGKNIRKYFLNDFYKDHVRRYKKRPIYWLFSSPKGSFNALIYMHRYRSDTVSVILNDYLREFRTKLEVRLANLEEVEASADASKRDKTAAVKEINQIRSTLDELEDWERKVMLPLAEQKIEIDLDDGVKANYPKFGEALTKVPGVSPTGGKK